MSQAELAEAVGVDQRTISSYEVGKHQFAVATGIAIAGALKVKYDELFAVEPEAVG